MSNEIIYTPQRTRAVAKGKPGRKTNLERLEIAAERERRTRQLEIESKRARRIQPDTRGGLRLAIALAAIPTATAGIISYATTVAVAGWMRLPWSPLDWIVPGMIEALVIFSSIDYIIARSRGQSGRAPLWAMIGFSAINVLGNGAHTVSEWGSDFSPSNWQALIGVVLSAASAFVVVYLSKRLTKLVFAEPES